MNKHTVFLIIILLLAAFLRFWNLDATEFKYDEATVCNLAAQFVDTGLPPVRGMGSSVGIDNPPLMIYLMSLPVLLSRDPLIVSGFVALLNVIGVWGCYALAQRYWGRGVGLLAALLLAISPWAVFYSRKVWAQNVLIPFVLLFFALLLAWLIDRRPWALAGAIIALAAAAQIHFAVLAFAPLLALLILGGVLHRTRLAQNTRHGDTTPFWKPLLVGVGVSLLLYTPYLAFDAFIGWRNVRTFLTVLQRPAQTHWEAVGYALLNIGGREIHALAGSEQFERFLSGIFNLRYWPDRVEEALAALGLAYLAVRWWMRRRDWRALARDGVLLLWLISPAAFYLRSRTDVFPHYLIPLYPAPYLALSILAVDACQWPGANRRLFLARARPTLLVIGAAGLAALIAWQSYLSLSIHAFVETYDTPGGMGAPVRTYRDIVKTLKKYVSEWNNKQVIVLCPGDQPRWDECPAVFQFLTSRRFDLRLADYNTALVFPQSSADTLVILAPGDSIAARELPSHADELTGISTFVREGASAYRFFRLPAGAMPLPPVQPSSTPVRLENGIALLGYARPDHLAAGQTVRVALYWRIDRVPDHPPAQGYSFTVNIIGADGQRYGQKDGPGQRVGLWRAGDALITWFDLALDADAPPGPYRLKAGMYVYTPPDRFETIHVLGADGQPAADAVDWPIN